MQLTCPNCAARYEVAAEMVPAEGRHVQCTACHTRWFEKPAARVTLSEDEILSRLDRKTPSSGPRLVAVPTPPPPPEVDVEPLEDDEPDADEAPAPVETPAAANVAPPKDDPAGAEVVPLTRAIPRPSPRLELNGPVEADPLPPPAPSRFWPGFGLALLLAAIAFAAYHFTDRLAAGVPVAKPALEGWEKLVDGIRSGIAGQTDGEKG